jgi:hypothetical protein
MELLLGLLIVLAMSEWREFRSRQNTRRLILEINKSKRVIDRLLERTSKLSAMTQEAKVASEQSYKASMEARITAVESSDIARDIKASVDAIMKEYELNSVPMGYQRGKFDNLEGL